MSNHAITDYDRKFDTKEVNDVIRSLCKNITDEEIEALMEKSGKKDKGVCFADFADIMAGRLVYNEIKEVFKDLDKNEDGKVTVEELKAVLSSRGRHSLGHFAGTY